MSNWQEVLDSFKKEFASAGPEKYEGVINPAIQEQSAFRRNNIMNTVQNTKSSITARKVSDDVAAAKEAAARKGDARREYNKSGGFNFFDGDNNPITPWEFALIKQLPIDKVLEGSYDPGDQQFLEDYAGMSIDVQQGAINIQDALGKIAEDYPNIFYGVKAAEMGLGRTPTPGKNYEPYRQQVGRERVASLSFSNDKESGNMVSGKKGVDAANKVLKDINATTRPQEAILILKEFSEGKRGMNKIDEAERELVAKKMLDVVMNLYPDVARNLKQYGL